MRSAIRRASSYRVAVSLGGCFSPKRSMTTRKRSRSSARSMLSGLVPMIGTPAASSALARFSGRLPAELDDHSHRPHAVADVPHVLDRQGLEEEAVGRVVVGADGLGVGVDHHHLVPVGAQGERGLAAAVVELDPLPDPVRPAAQDHHPLAVAHAGLVLGLVGRVIVRRDRLELRRAGVDQLEDWPRSPGASARGGPRPPSRSRGGRAGGRRTRRASPRAGGRRSPLPAVLADRRRPFELDDLRDVVAGTTGRCPSAHEISSNRQAREHRVADGTRRGRRWAWRASP